MNFKNKNHIYTGDSYSHIKGTKARKILPCFIVSV